MLKINFLLAIRKLKKDKKSFFINLIGSSVGVAAVILMILYVSYEDNYDKFNLNGNRLFRIERSVNDNTQNYISDATPYELADEVKATFPEVVNAASVKTVKNFFSVKDELIPAEQGLMADNSFLKMFSFKFLKGDKENALSQPMSIILSKSLANKLFSERNIIGKTVRLDKKTDFTITGIFDDYPEDSHIEMDYMISYNSFEGFYGVPEKEGWDKNYSCTYLLINDGVDINKFSEKMKNLLDNHKDAKEGIHELLSLRPITEIYLKTTNVRSNVMSGLRNNIVVIYLFMAIAFFTAFITGLNYINMNTSQLMNRELEIGMKKVLGITKGQLRLQFILESLIMMFCIIVVAMILVYSILPAFNSIVDRDLSLSFSNNWFLLLKILIFIMLLGFISGLYPVVYLSSLKISSFLQGNTSFKRRRFMRKALVVFQLLLAVPLIFNSILTIKQINYLSNKDIGFVKENLMIASVKTPSSLERNRLKLLKTQLLQSPKVLDYSISEGAPFFASGQEVSLDWQGGEAENNINLTSYAVDYDFLQTYKMKLLKGRWFSESFITDSQNACIINETAASLFGWDDPIGKTLDNGRLKVVGVVKDFNQFSLFVKIPPMMLLLDKEDKLNSVVSIKVHPGDREGSQRIINELFNDNFRETPVEFKFLDVGFDDGFMSVLQNVMRIFIVFSIIAVVLVVIGLFGLVSFALGTQRKMIAVRRVLGASVKSLFLLLSKEYLLLCGITMAISVTITYLLNSQFLNVFAYNVGVKFIDVLSVILITFLVVFITISGKIASASKESPVDSLTRE
jgi:putative ABC transport system permease protein